MEVNHAVLMKKVMPAITKMTTEEITKRKEQAVRYFQEGYNCAQSVALAYSDKYQIEPSLLITLAAPFGGGMGRLQEVCGSVTGMFLVLGLEHPVPNAAKDDLSKAARMKNYQAVKSTGLLFKEKMGSYLCHELVKTKEIPHQPDPSDPNFEYYHKKHCGYCVATAAEIVGQELMLSAIE